MSYYLWIPIGVGFLTILFVVYLAISVLRKATGTPAMQKVADAIFKGARAFLNRQYRTIAVLTLFAAVLVGGVLYVLSQGNEATRLSLAWHTSLAFLIGSICSGVSGYTGMSIAVKANSRTASAATRSLGEALTIALRGGAVSGFLVVALSLSLVFRCSLPDIVRVPAWKTCLLFWLASASVPALSRCLPNWAVAFILKLLMWVQIW